MDSKEKLFQRGLLSIVQEVHMSVTGAYLDLSDEIVRTHVDYLRYRLNSWEDGHKNTMIYDLRIKDLITTVIDEYDEHLA